METPKALSKLWHVVRAMKPLAPARPAAAPVVAAKDPAPRMAAEQSTAAPATAKMDEDAGTIDDPAAANLKGALQAAISPAETLKAPML